MQIFSTHRSARRGFSLIELMFAAVLLAVAAAMGLGGWARILRSERRNSAQAELDMDVRTAIERIRAEMRLSAVEKMVFYPSGPGPYEAVSFPVAFDRDNEGLVPMLSDTNILWDTTVVYHVDDRSPNRLMRTLFTPRDNDMALADREAQLAAVVDNGHGEGACGTGEDTSSRVIFENFFTWTIDPVAGVFDAYEPWLGRKPVIFGTAPIGPGNHTLTFVHEGRNGASSGNKLGLDMLCISPTGHGLEAEDQTIDQSTPTATRNYIPGGSWSGHHDLLVAPTGAETPSLEVSLASDRWEETTFRVASTNGTHHITSRFDFDLMDYVVRLTGSGTVWRATEQTGSSEPLSPAPPTNLNHCAFRVLIKGGENGVIHEDGRLVPYAVEDNTLDWTRSAPPHSFLRFRIPAWSAWQECYATIARAASDASPLATTGPFRFLRLYRDSQDPDFWYGVLKKNRPDDPANLGPMAIARTNSYVVSFWVNDYNHADARWIAWENSLFTGTDMTAVMTNAVKDTFLAQREDSDWSDEATVSTETSLCFLQELVTTHVKEGAYVSPVFDTTLDAPDYNLISWDAITPTDTSISIQARSASSRSALETSADWGGIFPSGNPGTLSGAGFGRYLQFRARLVSDNAHGYTPGLRRVVMGWPGELRMVDVGGVITVGPDYGAFRLLVDNRPLIKGVRVDLAIYKDVPTGGGPVRLQSSMSMEVEPRNSGK